MEKRNLKIIFAFLICIPCFCQTSPENFLIELREKKIDTICVFDDYSVGSVKLYSEETINDYCEFEPTYFFWKENNKTLLTKKDSCFEYSTIEINADKIWKDYFENERAITIEKVKHYQFIDIENGKKRILTKMRDHSHHQNFKIIVKEKITEKRFDDFDLLKSADSDGKEENMNYKYNLDLKSKTLINEIAKLVMKYERMIAKKRFNK